MSNQSELNNMSLKDASDKISDALISQRLGLQKKRTDLERLKEQYQEDYIVANADGDARENAPLEKAIENLKTTQGDIVAVTKKYQSLDNIEDSKYLNATYDYDIFKDILSRLNENSRHALFNCFGVSSDEELVERIKKCDENELNDNILSFDKFYGGTMEAELRSREGDDVLKRFNSAELNRAEETLRQQGILATEYRVLMELGNIREIKEVPPYNYCGIIVMYTTVRLRLDDTVMTYKIYPKGLSFIDIGVMSADAKLAKALMGKKKGDTVSIRHGSKNKMLEYEILDIY